MIRISEAVIRDAYLKWLISGDTQERYYDLRNEPWSLYSIFYTWADHLTRALNKSCSSTRSGHAQIDLQDLATLRPA